MKKFTCFDARSNIIETTNIKRCYCGHHLACPEYYSNKELYNSGQCCINYYCQDPSSDVCKSLTTIVGLTIGMIFLCCVGAFIFFFCFYRRRRIQREYAIRNSAWDAQRPELIELGRQGVPMERWEVKKDDNNREYYIDHRNKTSTWIKPPELKALEKVKSETNSPPPAYKPDD